MDIVSYIEGRIKGEKDGMQKGIQEGEKHVILEGTDYTFSDTNTSGDVVIEKGE